MVKLRFLPANIAYNGSCLRQLVGKMTSILTYPDKSLLKPCKRIKKKDIVSDRVRDLIAVMRKLAHDHNGIGLAAPQIGWNDACILVMGSIFFNPRILEGWGSEESFEGCLSIPGKGFKVERFTTVEVKFLDEWGQPGHTKLTGLPGIVFQHETDHCLGICLANNKKVLEDYDNLP